MANCNIQSHNVTESPFLQQIFDAKYTVNKTLRKSANGVIYAATDNFTKEQLVLKQIAKRPDDIFKNRLSMEIQLHEAASRACPDNIAEFYEYYERNQSSIANYVIAMERPKNSIDIFQFVSRFGRMSPLHGQWVMAQLVQTALKLKEAGVCHHDIKDENILVSLTDFKVKLIDFGCAKVQSNLPQKRFCGTELFFPPEFFRLKRYFQDRVTVWQLGCVMFIVLVGKLPFTTKDDVVRNLWIANRPELRTIHPCAADLISQMLHPDQIKRIRLEDIFCHPFWSIKF